MDSSGCRIETRPLTAEEEALKRNTDCVYFLASPLTCKKGTECEYRHSEGARLNPRDCWYWLNSNCLNPKCAFRHPPLDGLFESSGRTSVTVPTPLQTATSKPVPIPIANTPAYGLNKQSAVCIYFQKGHCLKGARCPFLHGPQSTASAVLQPTLPHQPLAFNKDQFVNQQSTRQCSTNTLLNISQVIASKSSEAPVSSAKLVTKTESNGVSHTKSLSSHPYINNKKFPKSHSMHTPMINNNAWSRADRLIHPSDDNLQDGLEPGEIVEDSSSRFNAVADSSSNGDEYVRSSSQGERKREPANGYSNHTTFGRDRYVGSVDESGRIGRTQDYRDTKPLRISSDRRLEIPSLPEKRLPQRRKSPDVTDSSDLRNRLKQRRLDCRQEPYERDAGYMEGKQGYLSRSDQVRDLPESSLSSPLCGRISLPGTSSAPNNNEGKQYERRRKASEEPPLLPNPRNFGGRPAKREDGDAVNFSGPKSLAELKRAKGVDSSKDQPTKSGSNKDREGSPLFEGPKPLSVLLKRKREEESIQCAHTGSGNEDCQRSKEPAVRGSVCTTTAEEQASCVAESNKEENVNTVASLGVQEVGTAEEDELIYDEHSSEKEAVLGTGDYMEVDEAIEEQELQHSDARDGESDYEATETGGFKEEYEIQGGEEVDDDDDDDDEEDFARKVGLLFS